MTTKQTASDKAFLTALVALAFLAFGLRMCDLPIADAQRREPDALLLARICVSEAGWECWDTGDGLAIHEVISTGATRHAMSWRNYAQRYASRATGARPTTHHRLAWVAQLDATGRRPAAWPSDLSWARYRPMWLDVLETAEDVLSLDGERAREWSPCTSEVHDWGGPNVDRERARRLGLIRVDCGSTRNDFYARPSLVNR